MKNPTHNYGEIWSTNRHRQVVDVGIHWFNNNSLFNASFLNIKRDQIPLIYQVSINAHHIQHILGHTWVLLLLPRRHGFIFFAYSPWIWHKNKKIHALGSKYNLSLAIQDSWANQLSSFQESEQVKGRNRTLIRIIPMLRRRKLRYRKVKQLALSVGARSQPRWFSLCGLWIPGDNPWAPFRGPEDKGLFH